APGAPSDAVLHAAARLATGDLAGAAAALPGVGRAVLLASYTHAFDRLLIALAIVTVLCAAIVFAFLGARQTADGTHADTRASLPPNRRARRPACAESNGR
ncbi:MFS transporter, partial [Burkholderia multivorans]|nr:MFS transporter [Burkholderia multivorans]